MTEKPIRDPRILEAIEACRPASGDLEDPALAFLAERLAADPQLGEVFERLQRLDATVTEAFREVPVPEGLSGRIKARLLAQPQPEGALGHGDRGEESGSPQPIAEVVGLQRHRSRRWLLAGATAVAIAASLVVAVIVRNPERVVYDEGKVLERAADFFEKDSQQQGKLVGRAPPREAFPSGIDFSLSDFPQMRWRDVKGFLGCTGVAYDISRRGGPRASLYVVKRTVPRLITGLPASPSRNLSRPTGNVSVSAWQTGELLYVLVVEGGPENYRGYVPLKTWT